MRPQFEKRRIDRPEKLQRRQARQDKAFRLAMAR